jgi:hypothetical protein
MRRLKSALRWACYVSQYAMKKHRLLWLLFLLLFTQAYGQERGYYLFPIKPNQPNELTGTMGELRSNHFHGGIDVRTNNQIGFPVYASADGYGMRIVVSPRGYGKAIYIKHPNNTITLYAHLDEFAPKIETYIRKVQYERERFEVDMVFAPNQFPIKKGEEIAKSGNSGSSGGPHLHYEIRDEAQNQLNPLLYGFDEIKDQLPPIIQKIAVLPTDSQARVAGAFERKTYNVQGVNGLYTAPDIYAYGNIAFEVMAKDKAENSHFTYGVNYIKVEIQNQTIFEYYLDKLPVEHTRYMNQFINYQEWLQTKQRFMRCYPADGNCLESCRLAPNDGNFFVEDGKEYRAKMTIKDSYGNTSTLRFFIKGKKDQKPNRIYPQKQAYTVDNQYLIFNAVLATDSTAKVYAGFQNVSLKPAYTFGNQGTYIYDLRKALPDSISLPNETWLRPTFQIEVPSEVDFKYYHPDFNLFVEKESLYDTLYLRAKRDGQDLLFLHADIPIHKAVTIHFKTNQTFRHPEKVGAYIVYGNHHVYEGGEWGKGYFKFSTRTLGRFRLREDLTPPKIQRIYRGGSSFRITDDLSGIGYYKATLNGQFLLMEYDAKNNLLTPKPLDENQRLKGELLLIVRDKVGNEATYRGIL